MANKRRRRNLSARCPISLAPVRSKSAKCYDFVFDACINYKQLKCLTLIDEYPRECLAIVFAGSIRSRWGGDVLRLLISLHGASRYLRSDNGPEFVSMARLTWPVNEWLESVLIDPVSLGKTGPRRASIEDLGTGACPQSGSATGWKPMC